MNSFFCPKCGTKLTAGTRFCPKCGANVQGVNGNDNGDKAQAPKSTPAKPATAKKESTNFDTSKFLNLSRRKKIIGICAIVAIVIFFVWGHIYYSEDNQLDRAIKAVGDPSKNAGKYITTNNSRVTVNNQSVKGIQNYYQKYPDALNEMEDHFEDGRDYGSYSFEQSGRALLFWKRYRIQVEPVYIKISTDQKGMNVTMDGQNLGEVNNDDSNSDNNTSDVNSSSSETDSYSKEFGPYLPGLHKFVGTKTVNGHKVKSVVTSSDTDITMNNGISNSTAQSLLGSAFTSGVDDNDEIFVGGQNNEYYKQLVDMFQGYNHDDDILSYNQSVNVNNVTPVSDKKFKVNYQVKYVFDNKADDDHSQKKIQIFKYTATIVKTDDTTNSSYNGLKIQSLGHAKKVSESSEDND